MANLPSLKISFGKEQNSMIKASITSKQDLKNALKRVDELWGVAKPSSSDEDELESLVVAIEIYEEQLLNDDKTWDSYCNGKQAKDFPDRGSQPQQEREDFN